MNCVLKNTSFQQYYLYFNKTTSKNIVDNLLFSKIWHVFAKIHASREPIVKFKMKFIKKIKNHNLIYSAFVEDALTLKGLFISVG